MWIHKLLREGCEVKVSPVGEGGCRLMVYNASENDGGWRFGQLGDIKRLDGLCCSAWLHLEKHREFQAAESLLRAVFGADKSEKAKQ